MLDDKIESLFQASERAASGFNIKPVSAHHRLDVEQDLVQKEKQLLKLMKCFAPTMDSPTQWSIAVSILHVIRPLISVFLSMLP